MHVLVIGAAGMVGRKLVEALVAKGEINGKLVERLTLVDIVEPTAPARFAGKVETVAADLSDEGVAAGLIAERPDLIFHLAAIVSGEAEADFEKGYRVNLDGTRDVVRGDPAGRTEGALQAEARLHLVDRRVRRAAARRSSATRTTIRRSPATARRRRSANFCSRTIRGAASSTASAYGCRRS